METPQSPKKIVNKWALASLAMEMGFIIAIPLVVLGLAGKWLDNRMNSNPWFSLLGIIIAIVSTTIWLTKRIKGYIK